MESSRRYSIEEYKIPNDLDLTSIKRFSHSNFYSSIAAIFLELASKLSTLKNLYNPYNTSISELKFYKYIQKPDIVDLSKSYPEKSEFISAFFELLQSFIQNPSNSLEHWQFYIEDFGHMQTFRIAIRIILLSIISPEKKALRNVILNDSDPKDDLINLFQRISNVFGLAIHYFDSVKNNFQNIKPDREGVYPRIYIVNDNGYHLGLTEECVKVITGMHSEQDVEKLFYTSKIKDRRPLKFNTEPSSESQTQDTTPKDLNIKKDLNLLEAIESLAQNLMDSNTFLPENTKIFQNISKNFEEKLIPKVKKYLIYSKPLSCKKCNNSYIPDSILLKKGCKCEICRPCINLSSSCTECSAEFSLDFQRLLENSS